MEQKSTDGSNFDPSYLKFQGQRFAPAIAEPWTEKSQLNNFLIAHLKSEAEYISTTAEVDKTKLIQSRLVATSPLSPVVSDEKSKVIK